MAEHLDDLQFGGLKVLRTDSFGYGQDAVLLANAVKARPGERVLELCCGCGVVAILAQGKTGAHFTGVELQPELCALARRSIAINGQEGLVEILQADIRTLHEVLGYEGFDAACCNPPYHAGGTLSADLLRRASTHQLECSMEDVALCSKRMLKNGGRLHITYPASGLAEALACLVGQGLQPKRVTPVCGREGKHPYLVLIEAKKGAAPGMVLEGALVLNQGMQNANGGE